MKEHLLFTPGPVNIVRNVKNALFSDDIGHREVEFDNLLRSVEDKLLKLFQLKGDAGYRAVVLTGSGTAANEAMLSSVVGNRHVLVLANGEFGERLHTTSKIHNKNTHLMQIPWGKEFDLPSIETYIKRHNIRVVAMVHHETSSGMLNPLRDIGTLAKQNDAVFIVDCVSSAGAEVIDLEGCNISFCSSSSSKAIGSHPGLSFVIGRTTEFEKLKHLPAKTTYLNLATFYQFLKTRSQTPNTPAVPLFFAFEQSLINILNEGVLNRFAAIRHKAQLLRDGMSRLGLQFLLDQDQMCSVLTAVHLPAHINLDSFRQKLRARTIIIYEGKGCFQHCVFQVGNIGELTHDDIDFFLEALSSVLQEFEIPSSQPVRNFAPRNIAISPAAIAAV